MFTPSAVSPPSAKRMPCISRTTETQSTPVYGPTRIAASAPPSRCPLVPAATGKFSICTAKMKAATRPASGAVRSCRARAGAPGARGPPELAPRAAQADGDRACRGHTGRDRDGRVDESVGHMHDGLRFSTHS